MQFQLFEKLHASGCKGHKKSQLEIFENLLVVADCLVLWVFWEMKYVFRIPSVLEHFVICMLYKNAAELMPQEGNGIGNG